MLVAKSGLRHSAHNGVIVGSNPTGHISGAVVELVDTGHLKCLARKSVRVRVPPAPLVAEPKVR